MNVAKRILSVLMAFGMMIWALTAGVMATPDEIEDEVVDNSSLIIWYTDDSLTDYLSAECVAFNEMYGIRVIPRLQAGDEYLENINKASVSDEGTPDLYLITNDCLEKAYLGGLACEVDGDDNVVNESIFPEAAIEAITYKGHKVGYPLFFETSALIYNWTYLHDMAENQITAEESTEPTDDGSEAGGEIIEGEESDSVDEYAGLTHDEKVAKRIEDSIPGTFDELETFANSFDAPEQVETVFKWDVKDIFYNYFFVGEYVDVGGPNGDDTSIIDIYNMDAITALTVYQNLNNFFSFEYEDISYASVLQEFMEGKLVFTTATTDAIAKLEQAKEDGTFPYEYGVAPIPNLTDMLTSKSMSVTNVVAVNGYSDRKNDAKQFARYLTITTADTIYAKTGKIPACNSSRDNSDAVEAFAQEYANSRPIPKMMATSNYWLQMEIAFAEIWAGGNVSDNLKTLSEQIKGQVTGAAISEDYIDLPAKEQQEMEYIDEEAAMEAARQENEADQQEKDEE